MWLALGVALFVVAPVLILAAVLRCAWLEYRPDRVPILLYHRLISREAAQRGEVPDEEMIYVSYDTVFEQQMSYLSQAGFTTLDLDDFIAIRAGRMPRPVKPILITFDDGYESNYTLAYPVLRRLGMKATIFVATDPDEYTRCLVKGVDGFLSESQMRELSENGVSIQSHTLTHCVLSELDEAVAMRELTESRRRLAEITGRPVNHLAIPRSGYSRRVRRWVGAAGYLTACGNHKGTACFQSDVFCLPRIVIERDTTVQDFARALTPSNALVLRIIGNLKRIPECVAGPRFAERLRDILYAGPFRPLFQTRNLVRLAGLAALLYALAGLGFVWHLLASCRAR